MKFCFRKLALCVLTATCLLFFSGFLNKSEQTENVQAAISSSGFLKTDGTLVRDNYGSGNIVFLRGTNAGAWLVQESWMSPTNAQDQKTTISVFNSRFGSGGKDALLKTYYDSFWSESDFDNCANMGMTCIRLPFTYMNLMTDDGTGLRSDAWTYLDWFVQKCADRGMYVILDLHGTFGSQNGEAHSGEVNDGYQLYWNDNNRGMTKWLWWQIANRYKDNPAVAGYDILNEPGIKTGTTSSIQWDLYDEIYDTIRSVDSSHIIIMESCWAPVNLPNPTTYGWTNVMYEYHWYPWDFQSNTSEQISSLYNFVSEVNTANFGVPVYIGEFNCFGLSDAWAQTLEIFKTNGFHWANWSYKTMWNGSTWGIYNWEPPIVNISEDSYDSIYWKWKSLGSTTINVNSIVYNALSNSLANGSIYYKSNPANGSYYLKSTYNNRVVCADNYGNDPLAVCRDTYDGSWEQLNVVNNSDGTVSFLSGANSKYVCTEIDDYKQLVARSTEINDWEKFEVFYSNGAYGLISKANKKFVQSDMNNGGVLKAVSQTINGAWEAFYIVSIN